MNPSHSGKTRIPQINRALILLFLIAGGMAFALPAWSQLDGDYNDDGVVDFCDGVIFVFDLSTQNLRSDFNGDGSVDFVDINIITNNYYNTPQDKVAIDGTATIGVYFDTAGTINVMLNALPNNLITFYVVAHNLPDETGGYTFEVVENSNAIILDETPPTDFHESFGHGSEGLCALGSTVTCLGPGSAIVLNTYELIFLGEDTTIEVQGLNSQTGPSEFPAYVSCGVDGVPCDWTYFRHDVPHGSAFITMDEVGVESQTWSTVKALYR